MVVLFLFIPSGSLYFWQGWVYSIIVFVSLTAIYFYLWKRDPTLLERIVEVGDEKGKSQKIIQIFVL